MQPDYATADRQRWLASEQATNERRHNVKQPLTKQPAYTWTGEIAAFCGQCEQPLKIGDHFTIDEGGSFNHVKCPEVQHQ